MTKQPRTTIILRFAALASLVSSLVCLGLFLRIPGAQGYVPLRLVDKPDAYEWTPAQAPMWFRTDAPDTPGSEHFQRELQTTVSADESVFSRQLAVMNWVRLQAPVADSILALTGDPVAVQQQMNAGAPAQCGNFATLFTAAASSNGLGPVRLWHLVADDGWSGSGHVLVEVWDPAAGQWVMLDPMNNTYVLIDEHPASLAEVRSAVLHRERTRLQPVIGPRSHTPDPDALLDVYAQTMTVVSLPAANDPLAFSYAPDTVEAALRQLPVGPVGGLALKAYQLLSGRARQIMLIDELSGPQAHRLPIRQAQALFIVAVASGLTTLALSAAVMLLAVRSRRGAR